MILKSKIFTFWGNLNLVVWLIGYQLTTSFFTPLFNNQDDIFQIIIVSFIAFFPIYCYENFHTKYKKKMENKFILNIYRYDEVMKIWENESFTKNGAIPSIYHNWDTTPRIGNMGYNSTPKEFSKHIDRIIRDTAHKNKEENIVF